jgi:WD40-like Beta Propeller Repeat
MSASTPPTDLARALREAPLPNEGAARERARRTVLAAHAASPRRRRPHTAAFVTAVVLAVAGAGALTRPGQAVGEWVGRQLEVVRRPAPPAPKPAPRAELPARGRLLVARAHGLAIVGGGGHVSLRGWRTGSWSPHALHLAVAAGRTLAAVKPDGTVRWRFAAPAPVAAPRWSPNALYVAYRAGSRMHLIWGNGAHDVALRGVAASVPPAWRPSTPSTLAWARADGTVLVQDAYTGRVLWRDSGGPVHQLSWSADGRRLLIAGRRHGAIHRLAGGRAKPLRLADGETLAAAAFAPAGGRLALAVYAGGVTRIRLLGAKAALFEVPGLQRSLTWSSDGRWVLAPSGNRWLLARAHGSPRLVSVPARGARPLSWSPPG